MFRYCLQSVHGFIIHISTMFNGIDAGTDSSFHSFGTMGMHGHFESIIFGCFNNCFYFFFRELRIAATFGNT